MVYVCCRYILFGWGLCVRWVTSQMSAKINYKTCTDSGQSCLYEATVYLPQFKDDPKLAVLALLHLCADADVATVVIVFSTVIFTVCVLPVLFSFYLIWVKFVYPLIKGVYAAIRDARNNHTLIQKSSTTTQINS